MYDDVPSRANLLTMQAEDFAEAPANPVAHHGAAQRLLHAHAETADIAAVWSRENYEGVARAPAPFPIRRLELRAVNETRGAGKPQPRARRA